MKKWNESRVLDVDFFSRYCDYGLVIPTDAKIEKWQSEDGTIYEGSRNFMTKKPNGIVRVEGRSGAIEVEQYKQGQKHGLSYVITKDGETFLTRYEKGVQIE